MSTPLTIYDHLAALLNYPDAESAACVERCRTALQPRHPDTVAALDMFCRETQGLPTEDLQELFTSTFDHNPATSLDIGWHLFGESYDRGAFLVRMRRELQNHGLAESTELPDHLTHVLALLGRLPDPGATEFAVSHVLPALSMISAGVEKLDNPYRHIVNTINHVLTARFGKGHRRGIALPVYREHENLLRLEDQ